MHTNIMDKGFAYTCLCGFGQSTEISAYRGVELYYKTKQNKGKRFTVVLLWLFLVCICIVKNIKKDDGSTTEKEISEKEISMKAEAVRWLEDEVLESRLPFASFAGGAQAQGSTGEWLCGAVLKELPVYGYSMEKNTAAIQTESKSTYALLIEREEGRDEERDEGGRYFWPEEDMTNALWQENEQAKADEVLKENEAALQRQEGFLPAGAKAVQLDLEAYRDFDALLGGFYAIDSTTDVGAGQLNIDALLSKDMRMVQDNSRPQILIYHTHSQESFADSVPGDAAMTIMGAGEKLAGLLREEYGFHVIHHTGQYDVQARDYAYSNAEPALEQILKENPSIEVIIDLHRDEMREGRKLVTDLNGRPTATFMFFNGLSRTKQRGDIEYLYNPYIADNLAFSFQMQVASNEYYPGLTRRIYLKGYRYNMHYRPKSLLIELGAQTNTVEEIMNACDPLAHIIAMVLKGEA